MGKLNSLQVLRFVAALGVVWEHASTQANPHHLTGGAAGVDLFFVLSGFVIARAAQTRPDRFLCDRLTRIFPTYWLWSITWLVLGGWPMPLDGWQLFTTGTLLPSPTATPLASYVGGGWTLSFELMFYTAVWLVLRGLPLRVLAVAYGALATASIVSQSALLHFVGSPMVIEFVLGLLAYHLGRGRPILGATCLAVACAAFPFLPKQLSLPQAALTPLLGLGRVALLGPLAFLTVWGAAQFDCSSRVWRPLVVLGDASYSVYLSNLLLIKLSVGFLGSHFGPAALAATSVGLGLLTYLLLERPLLRLTRRSVSAPGPVPQPEMAYAGSSEQQHPGCR